MGWLIVLVLAGAGFAALRRFGSLPKSALEVTGAAFLLGTTNLGRDVFSQLVFGARSALVRPI